MVGLEGSQWSTALPWIQERMDRGALALLALTLYSTLRFCFYVKWELNLQTAVYVYNQTLYL